MEYGTDICDELNADQFIKNVGYSNQLCTMNFYSQNNINKISRKITELLKGVTKDNRPIIVPDNTIRSVMSTVYQNYMPETGDIFGSYSMPNDTNYVQRLIDQVINIITTDVRVNLGIEESNQNLTIWTTLLGDFNEHGLRSHPKIKLREKRPIPLMFNMNY